ncbi:N-acetylneuraminate synthase family protein, partial [Luminiphilus sp.]|nr:N-acetylneuraminate synthase family protein [Luminiphilus sp.]
VDDHGYLRGVFSFGDLNRWLLGSNSVDLSDSVDVVMNQHPRVSVLHDSVELRSEFDDLDVVPVIDEIGRIIGVLEKRKPMTSISIAGREVGEQDAPFLIAEIGNNHNGSLSSAKELIRLAKEAGAHCAKFQLRCMSELYGNAVKEDAENLGSQYTLDLLKRFQLSNEDLLEALSYAESIGLVPLCTPWDAVSVDVLEEFGVPAYKVASADLTNHPLLRYLARTGKPLICSTGMATEEEIKASVAVLRNAGAQYVLLHCNSTYPAPFKDVNLSYIPRLAELGECLVGYSGHERDINVAVASVAMGAVVIEKHFTTDRSLEGNDHKVSLLPDEFRAMADGVMQVSQALGTSESRVLTQGEMMNRVTLAKSIYAKRDLKKGHILTAEDVVIKSPGRGLQPSAIGQLLAKPLRRDIVAGAPFYPDDIEDRVVKPRTDYGFWGEWGIPVRHHDYKRLHGLVKSPMLEFHLSYKDLELKHEEFFDEAIDAKLVVHAPELFFGDHVLDLTSPDDEYRSHSIRELKRTIEVVKSLKPYFRNSSEHIGLVTNVGGFSDNGPMAPEERDYRSQMLVESLNLVKDPEVEVLPQTMPPFPWHFGGQQFHNLFLDAKWIKSFCERANVRVCLDVSHSALYCNQQKSSLSSFLDDVLPFTAHLHLADAKGVDGEGLQIHEGEIDWGMVASKCKKLAPAATWLPEIWQGHENDGAGFWIALEGLAKEGF